MPLKLIPPRESKSPYWSVRGTYLRTYVDRSTKASDRLTAAKILNLWKEEIERGAFAKPDEPTFLDAAVNYMAETGNERFVQPVVDHFGQQRLSEPILEVWIQIEGDGLARRLSMIRIIARRTKAATVLA